MRILSLFTLMLVCVAANAAKAAKAKKAAPQISLQTYWQMADSALCVYNLEEADRYIESFRNALAKDKKATEDDRADLAELQRRLTLTRNMLDRVERVAVIDSMLVDSDSFLDFYTLSSSAGRLSMGAGMTNAPMAEPPVVYTPESNQFMIWSRPDTTDVYRLTCANYLGDRTLEAPVDLQGNLNDGGDANYPFMMPDGVTLYYAADGNSSLGGYDIYLTRKTDDGTYLNPQNIGMPYNSPYDDYMMAIDEESGIGWWATDRNRIPGKTTIYVFVPNDVRVNYDPDDPNISSLALLKSIKATLQSGTDYSQALERLQRLKTTATVNTDAREILFELPDGRVITSLRQVKSKEGVRLLEDYMAASKKLDNEMARLSQLREQFANGDRNVSTDIIRLEKRIDGMRAEVLRIRNAAVNALMRD